MDPLTQGALGAALPQSVARSEKMGLAMLCGVAGGMAPNLDVVIRSGSDPLLFLEYHRQFTHSLMFIPFGAAIVTLVLWVALGRRRAWPMGLVYGFTLLGYATHALLDACTSYGTLLLWPFSDERFAWNNVSIIDPLLTLPLLLSVLCSRLSCRRWPATLGMIWVLSYLSLGVLARDAAQNEGREIAISRGHNPVLIEAKPSFANLLLWKTIYREADHYHVDAVRLRLRGQAVVYPGESLPILNLSRDFPWLDPDSVQAKDVERFRWFSMGYVAADPSVPDRIIDIRYSLLPNEIKPLWSIELDQNTQSSQHVRYVVSRERDEGTVARLWTMISGKPL